MNVNTITYVPLTDIVVNPRNPRSTFSKTGIEELADSINSFGVLQPILVRRVLLKKAKKYEIVAGQRRFLACQSIKTKTMPCIVQDLNDAQAFEASLTENLQRIDITPMDEAICFHSLLQQRGRTIETIAAKFGKSRTHIASRVKLINLTEDFRKVFAAEFIDIRTALEIALLPSDFQEIFFNENFSDWETSGEIYNRSFKETRQVIQNKFSSKLSRVTFSLTDKDLNPEAGACSECPSNTANTAFLFTDIQVDPVCLNAACMKIKNATHLMNIVQKTAQETPEVIMGYESYVSPSDKPILEHLVDSEIVVQEFSHSTGFDRLEEPEKPEPPDPADYDQGIEDEDYKEDLHNYNTDELSSYQEELDEFHADLASSNAIKVLMVAGNRKGEFQYFTPSEKLPERSTPGANITVTASVKELEQKKKRNIELCYDKVYQFCKEYIKASTYYILVHEITSIETLAFYQDIDCRYPAKPFPEVSLEACAVTPLVIDGANAQFIFRHWLFGRLCVTDANYQKKAADSLVAITEYFFGNEIKKEVTKIKEGYAKKNSNLDERIKELESAKL
jgi:ParB family chromosome partitioning protein